MPEIIGFELQVFPRRGNFGYAAEGFKGEVQKKRDRRSRIGVKWRMPLKIKSA
jgi:hypothetical protein